MGNGTSSTASTLGIYLQRATAIIGEPIHGKVLLHVTSGREACETLNIRLTCVEYSSCERTAHGEKVICRENVTPLDVDYVLTRFPEGHVAQGSFEFPFTLTVPSGMPPSIEHSVVSTTGGSCSVTYTLHARLHRRGLLSWDVQEKKPIKLMPAIPINVPCFPLYCSPVCERISYMCCVNAGNMVITISSLTNIITAGCSLQLQYAVINRSSARIESVDVALEEHIAWKAHRRSSYDIVTLASRTFYGDSMFACRPQSTQAVVDIASIDNELQQLLAGHQLELQVPTTTRSCMKAKLISIAHKIRVTVHTEYFSNDAILLHPISVIPTRNQNEHAHASAAVALPANWSATAAPLVSLPMPEYTPPKMYDATTDELGPPPPYNFTAVTPASILQKPKTGFAALQEAMNNTYDRMSAVEQWLRNNSPDDLTPPQLHVIFDGFSDSIEQVYCARALCVSVTSLKCEQIAAIVGASHDTVRHQVLSELASKCSDEQNYEVIRKQLSPYVAEVSKFK